MEFTNKKVLAYLVAITMAFALIAGCGGTSDPTDEPGEGETPPPGEEEVDDEQTEVSYLKVDHTYGFEFPGDWNNFDQTDFTAFAPGTASWQWLNSEEHAGSGAMDAGTGCLTCHEGDEENLGNSLISGDNKNGLEPQPVPGKEGFKNVTAQAAYDNEKFYLKLQWASERPGISHQLWRYDGEEWSTGNNNKPQVLDNEHLASYEDRMSLIIDDQNIPAYDGANIGFADVGCWQTCHEGMREMPGVVSSDEVTAHPYLGDDGKGRSDVRKYLLTTRNGDVHDELGSWADIKPEAELEQMMDDGLFLDLWQYRAARSGPIGYASDDYVFEYRWGDDGTGSFATPNQPEYMYNKDVLGFNAIHEDDFEENLLKAHLIRTETEVGIGPNVVPFDPNVEFKEGDLLPRRILQQPEGSVADVRSYSTWEDGMYTMTFVRDLDTGERDDKVLTEGQVYNVGFGVFDDHTTTRRHYVTLPMTLGIGADADIKAVKIE